MLQNRYAVYFKDFEPVISKEDEEEEEQDSEASLPKFDIQPSDLWADQDPATSTTSNNNGVYTTSLPNSIPIDFSNPLVYQDDDMLTDSDAIPAFIPLKKQFKQPKQFMQPKSSKPRLLVADNKPKKKPATKQATKQQTQQIINDQLKIMKECAIDSAPSSLSDFQTPSSNAKIHNNDFYNYFEPVLTTTTAQQSKPGLKIPTVQQFAASAQGLNTTHTEQKKATMLQYTQATSGHNRSYSLLDEDVFDQSPLTSGRSSIDYTMGHDKRDSSEEGYQQDFMQGVHNQPSLTIDIPEPNCSRFSVNFGEGNFLPNYAYDQKKKLPMGASFSPIEEKSIEESPTASVYSDKPSSKPKLKNHRDSMYMVNRRPNVEKPPAMPPMPKTEDLPPIPRKSTSSTNLRSEQIYRLRTQPSVPAMPTFRALAVDNDNFFAAASPSSTSASPIAMSSASQTSATTTSNMTWTMNESPVLDQMNEKRPLPFTTNGTCKLTEFDKDGTPSEISASVSSPSVIIGSSGDYDIGDWKSKLDIKLGMDDDFEISLKSPADRTSRLASSALQPLSANTPRSGNTTAHSKPREYINNPYKVSQVYSSHASAKSRSSEENDEFDFEQQQQQFRVLRQDTAALATTAPPPPRPASHPHYSTSDCGDNDDDDDNNNEEDEEMFYEGMDPGMKKKTLGQKFKHTFRRKPIADSTGIYDCAYPPPSMPMTREVDSRSMEETRRKKGLLKRFKSHMKNDVY